MCQGVDVDSQTGGSAEKGVESRGKIGVDVAGEEFEGG